MNELSLQTKVELAIVAILTLGVVLMKELNVGEESLVKTMGLGTVTFIALVLLLNLYRGFKNGTPFSNEETK